MKMHKTRLEISRKNYRHRQGEVFGPWSPEGRGLARCSLLVCVGKEKKLNLKNEYIQNDESDHNSFFIQYDDGKCNKTFSRSMLSNSNPSHFKNKI